MNITGLDLIHVTHGADDSVNVTGAAVDGGAAVVWLHIRHRHLGYHAVELIWRAVRDAGHVTLVGLADVRHDLQRELADRAGHPMPRPVPLGLGDALAEAEAYDALLDDIAALRWEASP